MNKNQYETLHKGSQTISRLLSVAEVAEYLSVSRSFVYKLINHEYLPAVQIGSAIRVVPEDLHAFIAEQRTTAGEGLGLQ